MSTAAIKGWEFSEGVIGRAGLSASGGVDRVPSSKVVSSVPGWYSTGAKGNTGPLIHNSQGGEAGGDTWHKHLTLSTLANPARVDSGRRED